MYKKTLLLSAMLVLLLASVSFGALSIDQQAVVDATDTMISDMTTVAWGFVLAVSGALVAIKVFKKFLNRGTS